MPSKEATVGGIVGFLRLENDQFLRAIDQAIAKSERLDGKQIDVQVDVDTAGANAQLAATEKQVDKLDRANARIATSAGRAGRGMRPLVAAILTLGPALIPTAAGVTALGVAFGGMATAGVLAVVGIRKEMEEGTAVGEAYRGALTGAKDDLTDLGRVAARNVLKPFLDMVDDLNARMPALRGQIGELATVTGSTAAALSGGLLNAFQTLEPLMRDASVYVLRLSESFRTAMSGQGMVAFGDYIRSVFPQVLEALGSITAAGAHLVQSLAPLGLGILTGLQMLSDLLRLIPVDVLDGLAQGAFAVFLGFRAWKGLSALIDGVNGALGRMNSTLALSAGALRAVNIAAGVIGIALAGLSLIVSRNAEQQRQAEDAVNRYADALRASNGVIDESVRQSTAKELADRGVLEAARQLGLNLPDVTSAALGNADAMARVNAAVGANPDVWIRAVTAGNSGVVMQGRLNGAADKVRAALLGENEALDAGVQKNKDIAAATSSNATETSRAEAAARVLADRYGVSLGVYQTVATNQQGIADKAAAATLQMQLENNAAGLLKQSLDLLSGKSLSAAQAQNAFDSQLANMGTHVDKTGKQITFTTSSINNMSAASVALRGQLLGQITSAQQTAEAYGEMKGSSEEGRLKLIDLKKQIIDNAVAHGVDRDAVTKYVNEFLKIPKKVPPTKLEVDKKAAEAALNSFKTKLLNLNGKTVTTYIRTVASTVNAMDAGIGGVGGVSAHGMLRRAGGGPVPGYAGGTLVGPGTGTSDSILAMVAQTGRMLRVSAGEFVSTDASRRRNQAALEAGNKGATLQVAGDGPVELGDRTLRRLVKLMSQIRPVVSVDALDGALARGY